MMPQIFISYARGDVAQVDRLAARLDAAGHSVFVDRDSITPGDSWRNRIVEAIDKADIVLVALSPASVASREVRREVEIAEGRQTPIIPLMIEPASSLGELRYHLSGLQQVDLTADFEAGVTRLLRDLRRIARRAGVDPDADDPDLMAPLDAVLADPELSTQEKIRRWLDLRQEQLAQRPSDRRWKEIEERTAAIDAEIAEIYLQYSPIPPDDEKFNPYAIEDFLPDFERERLSALKLELAELRKERMALIEAGLQRNQALTKKADALIERYDRIIKSIIN